MVSYLLYRQHSFDWTTSSNEFNQVFMALKRGKNILKLPSGINKGCLFIFDMAWSSLHLTKHKAHPPSTCNHESVLQTCQTCPYFTRLFMFPLSFHPLFHFHMGDYECVMSWLELVSALCAPLYRVRNHSLSENNWAQARLPAHYPQIIAGWGNLTGDNNDFGEFGNSLWWKLLLH